MKKTPDIVLGLLAYAAGSHSTAWWRSDAPADATTNIDHYRNVAALAERGLFDLFFLADNSGAQTENLPLHSRFPHFMSGFEPITLLSTLAASTRHIGLGATASTSYYEPYNIARLFASLDHLSGGRAGWNVVTSANDYAARNFGLDRLPPHPKRYARAREFLDVVLALWDTWEDDAFIGDKEQCKMFLPEKYHVTDHDGEFFKVYGGLNIKRTPQGRPVVIQAGASEDGKALAARTAEVVFSSEPDLAAAQRFYADVKDRMAAFGRERDELKILPGLSVMVGSSRAEAEDKYRELQSLIHPDVGRARLSTDLEMDLSDLPLDEPIPEHLLPEKANLHHSYFKQITTIIREQKPTLRQLYSMYDRGKATVCGTPEQIVDYMEEWMDGKGGDGFMLSFHLIPNDMLDFVQQVVPEMQRRGRFRERYTGKTLRENLGLAWPANRYASH